MAKRILIVDDDEMVLVALGELLQPEGYEVKTVPGAREALEALEQDGFDLLILDIIMPEMSGIELCKRIRATEGYGDTPIVFLTAKSSDEDRVQSLAAGADHFLSKPIAPDQLVRMVAKIIA